MKVLRSIGSGLFFSLALGVAAVGFAETKPAASKAAKAADVLKVDPAASAITWVGEKVTGQHDGTVNVKDGELHVSNGAVVDGKFTIDMTSIKNLDLKDPGSNAKLTGHLKSDDFFAVDKFPTATFDITSVTPMAAGQMNAPNAEVKGDLTIKGITKPLSFPATITVKDGTVQASASNVKIDRTQYEIRYGSGKFFQNLGDKMINDDFTIGLKIAAKK